jgi:hypothetical protein
MIPEVQILWAQTLGDPEIRVAVLDGPVDIRHPSLCGARLSLLPTVVPNVVGKGIASRHGTSIASVLFGQHSVGPVLGAAPGCTGLLLPIFSDDSGSPVVACSQLDLARAIVQATENHAHIINVSGGQYSPSGEPHPILREAVDYASSRDVLIVAAAGNDGCECLHLPGAMPSVLAVGALGRNSQPLDFSNWGAAYSQNGIVALGENIKIALPGGQYGVMTGTSCAAAIVAGVAGLLLSVQRKLGQAVRPNQIRQALLKSAVPCDPGSTANCNRMMAGQLNIPNALQLLFGGGIPMPTESDQNSAQVEPEIEVPLAVGRSQVHPSDCGCGCGGSKDSCATNPTSSASSAPLQLVYAVGTLGFDFGSEARRDSILQHATAGSDSANLTFDLNALLKYLDKNPWDAQSLRWTLNLDGTPIYVIQPAGAFAAAGYDRLRQFLREQVTNAVERVSVPGIVVGRARLMNGQFVTGLVPDLRGMNNWNTSALVDAVSPAKGAGKASHLDGITSFLNRIYYGFRNLGLTPQDRALNFAATNALNAARVFESALKDGRHLDTVEVERSPICRPESDCWDVKLVFFDPEHQTQRARMVYRFTVDVSDINPVMVGPVRSWQVR